MNVVVDEALELCKNGTKNEIGMVVSSLGAIAGFEILNFSSPAGHSRQQYNHGGSFGADMNNFQYKFPFEGIRNLQSSLSVC